MGDGVSVGVDLVEVDRFARALEHRPGLLERIFSDAEIGSCADSRNSGDRLAARFAAKEAVFKALGRGWPDIAYHDVEVFSERSGSPSVTLRARAADIAGDRAVSLSLSHAGGFAMAQVVLFPGGGC